MALNKNALRIKVKKAKDKMPDTVQVYRQGIDDFGEDVEGDIFVTEITGQYYDKSGGVYINLSTKEAGTIKDNKREKFMVVVDDNSNKIKEGDFFTLNGVSYFITDLGNTMDVYYDFSLERI